MKKKSIIIILLAAIALVLTTFITTKAETTINLGSTKNFNYSSPKGGFNNSINLTNALEQYFCGDHSAQFGSNTNYTKKNIARAEIVNNIATVYALKGYNSTDVSKETVNPENLENLEEEAKYANKILATMFYKIKQKTNYVKKLDINIELAFRTRYFTDHFEESAKKVADYYSNLTLDMKYRDTTKTERFIVTDVQYKESENEEKIELTRTRNSQFDSPYAFLYDYGQFAMWNALSVWRTSLNAGLSNSKGLLPQLSLLLQNSTATNVIKLSDKTTTADTEKVDFRFAFAAMEAAIAEAYGAYLYDQAVEEAKTWVDNPYGIARVETEDETVTREEIGTDTILGPFTYKFGGTIENGKPTLKFAEDGESQSYTIWEYEGDKLTNKAKITSETPFYITVPTNVLKGVSNIYFYFQVEGISLYNTKTTVYFYTDKNLENSVLQPVIYIEQEEVGNEKFEDTYTLSEPIDVSLEKLDISGNPLKAEGIMFGIFDETNEKEAFAYFKTDANGNGIVTDANGNPTGETTVKLFTNQTYTLVESENNYYGYKKGYLRAENIEISGAEIEQSENNVKFEIKDENVEQVTIKAKNDKELANLEIEKIGQNGEKLENVSFVIQIGANQYIQLRNSEDKIVATMKGSVAINSDNIANENEYHVEYVTDKNNATQFITTLDGKIVINNLEVNRTNVFKYWYTACEVYNPNYGYGSKVNISISESAQLKLNETNKITIKNTQALGSIDLKKYDRNNQNIVLPNVGFAIEITESSNSKYGYLALYNEDGELVQRIKDTAVINNENVAKEAHYIPDHYITGSAFEEIPEEIVRTEYSVSYYYTDKSYKDLTDEEKANITIFVTGDDGTLTVNNLEVYSSKTGKEYTYKIIEAYNPHYGYFANYQEANNIKLKVDETNAIQISNTRELGNLEIKKYDKDNQNIVLPNVEFVVEISSDVENKYGYVVLYNQNGELVQRVKDIAKINNKNEANDTEYRVSYHYTDKPYKELTDKEKENITIFLTGDDGILTINNLQSRSLITREEYIYKLIEIFNPHYGYAVNYDETGNLKLNINETIHTGFENKLVYTKISGYVWVENPLGKANEHDNVYTNNGNDQILTDLYILENGKLIKNPDAEVPVEIKLRDRQTGEIIKELPDSFDGNGKYTFTEVLIEHLENYEVVFEYDGFYYTTVGAQLKLENGSKVGEVANQRVELNNKFASVEDNAQVISTDGTINTVEYYKDGHTSTLSKLNFDTTISANTAEVNYNLSIQPLDNVNMGIVLREQPKISINSDIYSTLIEFEGYKYNYKYNGRQNYYENVNGDDIGVKFEQEYTVQRYTRTVYASDIQTAVDFNKEVKLSITYKIQLANQSKTLNVMPKQIINYFDYRYAIEAIGLGLDETNHTITNTLAYSTPQEVEGLPEYKSTIIDFGQLIGTESNVKDLYITFNVSREAILDLLNSKSTYHNASEILSYATYYSEETVKTEKAGVAGELYAGIDKMSQPGNAVIKLVDHPSGEGTQIIDTTDFEDDTTSAPSLILEAAESRRMSGTIWEDADANTTDNERLGNGIFDEGEKVIQGVKVELYNVDASGKPTNIATYSNGEQAIAITDESGNYSLGYYDEVTKKYVGILPGKYVIKYTYNNDAYIVGKENVNVNDYKSTIMTSEIIKNAFNGQNEKWYLVEEDNRYSDARDDISLRKEFTNTNSNFIISNSTYSNDLAIEHMNAYTPIMDIGIEFTEFDEADVLTLELLKEFKNIDFGIVERPKVDITIKKEITGLEIIAQNGTSIIPYGNPADINARMQYVKALPGLVSAEIEADLLQGAELKLEYTITVVNNSEKDYLEENYYYYGTGGVTEITTKPKQVADYMSGTMTLDLGVTPGVWTETTAEDLYNQGLLSEETYRLLSSGNYNILTTDQLENVGAGDQKAVKLYASKYLAISDLTRERNIVEIIELSGIRTIKDSVPGNYEPSRDEPDDDKVDLVITPPTGTTVNYIAYIIAGIATFAILVIGIVIIKKKLIK